MAQDLTKALAASHLAGLALLMAALHLSQSVGQTASLPKSVAFPLLLAALLRLGLYPLHLWLPTNMERSSPAVVLLHILPTSAGMYLLMRLCALSPQGLPQRDILLLVGSLALVASALLVWRGEGSRGWPSYLLVNQVAYAVLVMALDASPQGLMAALLQTLNLVLAWSIVLLRGKSGWVGERVILGMAVASLLGLPLTLGFPTRWLLYGLAFEEGHRPLIVAGAVTNLITAVLLLDVLFGDALSRINTRASLMERFNPSPLLQAEAGDERSRCIGVCTNTSLERDLSSGSLRESASGQEEGKRDEVSLIGLGLLAAPLLLFGLLPSALPIKLPVAEAWLPSVDGGMAPWSLALILVSPLGGYLLHRWGRVLDRIAPILEKLCAIISLEWLYRSLWWLSLKAGNVLQGAMGTIEGERCLGWLLFSAFVVTLLLLGE